MNTQKYVSTTVENIKGETVSVRQCTEPSQKVKEIDSMMGYKIVPFYRKKSVVTPAKNSKIILLNIRQLWT